MPPLVLESIKKTVAAISSLGRHRKWEQAFRLFNIAQRRRERILESPPDKEKQEMAVIRNATMNAAAMAAAWEAALFLLHPPPNDSIALNTAMKSLSLAGKWWEALKLLESETASNNVRSCEQVIQSGAFEMAVSACKNASHWLAAHTVLEYFHRWRFSPNIVGPAQLAKERDVDQHHPRDLILRQIKQTCEAGSRPNLSTYASAISTCGNWGRGDGNEDGWQVSLALMEHMRLYAVTPDVNVYNSVINACGSKDQWRWVLEVLSQVPRCGPINAVSYTAAINACERGHGWHAALACYENMISSLVKPNAVTYKSVLNACRRGRHWKGAIEFLRGDGEFRDEIVNCHAAIGTCEKAHQWNAALLILRQAIADSLPIECQTYRSAISACEKRKRWKHALALLAEMPEADLPPDLACFNAAVSSCEYTRKWEQAVSVFANICAVRLEPDIVTFNSLMSAQEKAARWEEALLILTTIIERSLGPDWISYGIALSACAHGRKWLSSLDMLTDMRMQRINADAIGLSSTLGACESSSQPRAAQATTALAARALARWALGECAAVQGREPGVLVTILASALQARSCCPEGIELALARRLRAPVELSLFSLAVRPHAVDTAEEPAQVADAILEGVAGFSVGGTLDALEGFQSAGQGISTAPKIRLTLASTFAVDLYRQSTVLPKDPVTPVLLAWVSFDLEQGCRNVAWSAASIGFIVKSPVLRA